MNQLVPRIDLYLQFANVNTSTQFIILRDRGTCRFAQPQFGGSSIVSSPKML
jgi:hypothetical protein